MPDNPEPEWMQRLRVLGNTKPSPPPPPAGRRLTAIPDPDRDTTAYAQAALERECDTMRNATEGTRNDTLNRCAFNLGQLIGQGITEQQIVDELGAAARATGLPEAEIRAVLHRSAADGHTKAPRIVPPPIELPPADVTETTLDQLTTTAAAVSEPAAGSSENEFWQARPVLSHIHTFAHARTCSPWAVLGGCLLRALATIPPTVVLPPLVGGVGSLNLFVALVGPSGAGKGASEAAAAAALTWPGLHTVQAGSGEGLTHQYAHWTKGGIERDRDAVLFSIPEIDALTALGNRQGSTLLSQLRSAFSGEPLGFAYADATKRVTLPRHTYRLVLSLGAQPGRARALLDGADGGDPQRYVWLPVTDPTIPDTPPDEPVPLSFAPILWDYAHGGGHLDPEGRIIIQIPDQVADEIRASHRQRARGGGDPLDGHRLFVQEKVAVALAVLDRRGHMILDDWELAGRIMAVSDRTRASVVDALKQAEIQAADLRAKSEARRQIVVSESVSSAKVAACGRTILRRLNKVGGEATRAELRRALRSDDRVIFDDAVEHLKESGLLVENVSGGGVTYAIPA